MKQLLLIFSLVVIIVACKKGDVDPASGNGTGNNSFPTTATCKTKTTVNLLNKSGGLRSILVQDVTGQVGITSYLNANESKTWVVTPGNIIVKIITAGSGGATVTVTRNYNNLCGAKNDTIR